MDTSSVDQTAIARHRQNLVLIDQRLKEGNYTSIESEGIGQLTLLVVSVHRLNPSRTIINSLKAHLRGGPGHPFEEEETNYYDDRGRPDGRRLLSCRNVQDGLTDPLPEFIQGVENLLDPSVWNMAVRRSVYGDDN